MTQQATDFTLDTASELAELDHGPIEGRSPWYLAWRRLRRNYVALAALMVLPDRLPLCDRSVVRREHCETGPNRPT